MVINIVKICVKIKLFVVISLSKDHLRITNITNFNNKKLVFILKVAFFSKLVFIPLHSVLK